MDLGQIIQWIFNALGGLPGIVQSLFPQIAGIGYAVNAATWTINQMTQGGINQLQNNMLNVLSNVSNNINANIAQAENYLGSVINTGISGVNQLVNNFRGDFWYGVQGLAQFIGTLDGFVNKTLDNILAEQNRTTASLDAITNYLTAGNNPTPYPQELNFWQQLASLPSVLEQLFVGLPSELASKFMNRVFQDFTGIDKSVASQWFALQQVIDNFTRGKYKDFNSAIADMQSRGIPAGIMMFVINLSTIALMLMKLVSSKTGPMFEAIDQMSWADNPTKMLDTGTIIELVHRGILTQDKANVYFHKLGLSDENIYLMMQTADRYPDVNTLTQYFWRGKISETSYRQTIERMGLLAGTDDMLVEISHQIPGPADLTRIADKQVWQHGVPDRYGQGAELPIEYTENMRKWGFDPEWSNLIWRAHWELPSPQQLFEMYQRHFITYEDMQNYLKLTPWLPFFRDKMLSISFNPLTRVDIRRMYGLGMFSYQELITRYEAIGFSPDDARLMADFTVKFDKGNADSDLEKLKNKIATQVQNLYVRGKLDYTEATNRLVALGRDRQMAQLELNYLNLERSIESTPIKTPDYKTKVLNIIVQNYIQGTYPLNDMITALKELGFSDSEAQQQIAYLDLEKQVNQKKDIVLTYETMFLNGAIDQSEFISNMSKAGLDITEINMEVNEVKLKQLKKFRVPTELQVKKWFADGVVTQDYVLGYLSYIGYPENIIPLVALGDYGIEV